MQDFSDIKEFKSNFYEKYHTVLVPIIEKMENTRRWYLFGAILWAIIFAGGGIAYIWFVIKFNVDRTEFLSGFAMIAFGLFFGYYMCKKDFESKLKSKIMHIVTSCFGNMVWSTGYYPLKKAEKFVEAGLFPSFSKMYVDERFAGTYKGVPIDIVEASYSSSDKYIPVFDGLCIKLDMNKNFKGHTILMEDTILHTSPRSHLRHTELEDVNFEKRYDVFTDDEIEARYILTPTFMEKLTGIKMAFYCKSIRCAFYQGEILIAMKPTTDLFSIGSLFRPVADTRQFQNLCNQFCSVLSLIDYLKLNERAIL